MDRPSYRDARMHLKTFCILIHRSVATPSSSSSSKAFDFAHFRNSVKQVARCVRKNDYSFIPFGILVHHHPLTHKRIGIGDHLSLTFILYSIKKASRSYVVVYIDVIL